MAMLTVSRDPQVEAMIRRLVAMNDRGFRQEVDADLRRPQTRRDQTGDEERRVYETRRAALRSPELVDRWTMTLLTMSKSVEGQLASKQEDHEAAKAALRIEIADLERRLATDPTVETKLFEARQQWEVIKRDYASKRADMLRFKTGLDEWVIEARSLRDAARATMYDSVIAEERNHYAAQVTALRAAIDTHRTSILEDEDYEPSSADERLWSCLP